MEPITFPGLGLEFDINPVAIQIFGLEVYWYGIIISAAFLVAVILALRDSGRFGINQDDIVDLVIIATPIAILGARLYYVIFNPQSYMDNIWEIFNVRRGGIAIYGAILASTAAAYIFSKYKRIDAWKLFDFASPYFVLAQAIGRWGNFVNQEAYGTETNLPWRMEIFDYQRLERIAVHPAFLYESLWNVSIFAVLVWYRKRKKAEGEVFLLYMILYGIGRFWIEGLRTDSLYLGPVRVSQLLAGVLAVSMTVILYIKRKRIGKSSMEV